MIFTILCQAVCISQRAKAKTILVMKLTAVFLLAGFLQVSAAGFSQTVTITKDNIPLQKLFREIKKQTGYVFFYNMRLLQKTHPVNIDVKNKDLKEVLDQVFTAQPVTYSIVNKTVVVNERIAMPAPVVTLRDTVPVLEISGKVVDAMSGTPVVGANVLIKGSETGVATDVNGVFTIRAKARAVLVISYVGFENQQVTVKEGVQVSVRLKANKDPLADVVITGYQQIKKESFTGNAVTVTGEELKRVNPTNILQSIQAYDPSFQVQQNNLFGSNPNALPNVNIRGSASLPTGTDGPLTRNNLAGNVNLPTFILDGYEVSVEKVYDMDVNRIQSITILKDAAATAVYGSRAANGVLVITTKAPAEGKLQVSYNTDLTVTAPDLTGYSVLNATDKLEYEKLAGLYETGFGGVSKDELEEIYYKKYSNVIAGVNTYWLSQPVKTAFAQKHSMYIEGGSGAIRYGIDLRYQTQPGVMKGSGRDRYGIGSVLSYAPNKRFTFKNSLTITQVEGTESPYGNFSNYVRMNPYHPKTDSGGHIIQSVEKWLVDTKQPDNQYQVKEILNPLFNSTLNNFNKNKYFEMIEAFSADWNMSSAFRLRATASLTKRKYNTDIFTSPRSNEFYSYDASRFRERGSYYYSNTDETILDGNATFNYNKQLGDHFINLAAGANIRNYISDFKSTTAIGFSNDRFTNIAFANSYALNSSPRGDYNLERLFGSFASLNYSYRNKYMADLSARLDGSSKFGSENKTAPFWALGVGWNAHREDFLLNSAISMLKLRASVGQTGSVSFPAYQAKTTYDYYTGNWYSTGIGASVNNYGNESLRWQKTDNYEAGVDLGLLNDKIFIGARYYEKITHGLLADIILPPSTGFISYKENLGDMNIKATVFKNRDWTVNLTANMARNKNIVLKISNALKAYNDKADQEQVKDEYKATPILRFKEGESLNAIYAVRSMGIDPETGREVYVNRSGQYTYDWNVKDIVVVGDNTPTAYGYFGGNISYKRFLLNVIFYSRFGGKEYNQTVVDRIENADPRENVDSRAYSLRWKKPGDKALYKNIAEIGQSRASERFVQKDNVLELQSLYLSYDFAKQLYSKLAMRSLRVAFTMNDIGRWATMQTERGIDYPFARSFTFSIQTSF
jgi:TonB-linked SusC/RagA family outer membrane protein